MWGVNLTGEIGSDKVVILSARTRRRLQLRILESASGFVEVVAVVVGVQADHESRGARRFLIVHRCVTVPPLPASVRSHSRSKCTTF
jgi:hypothetical protein